MNICVECKHFKKGAFGETKTHECKHPDCRHPVSGFALACVELRKPKGVCGAGGSLFAVGHVGQTFVHKAVAHDLFKDGDANIPSAILDRNGQVALGQCKRCGRAEVELSEPCEPRVPMSTGPENTTFRGFTK